MQKEASPAPQITSDMKMKGFPISKCFQVATFILHPSQQELDKSNSGKILPMRKWKIQEVRHNNTVIFADIIWSGGPWLTYGPIWWRKLPEWQAAMGPCPVWQELTSRAIERGSQTAVVAGHFFHPSFLRTRFWIKPVGRLGPTVGRGPAMLFDFLFSWPRGTACPPILLYMYCKWEDLRGHR